MLRAPLSSFLPILLYCKVQHNSHLPWAKDSSKSEIKKGAVLGKETYLYEFTCPWCPTLTTAIVQQDCRIFSGPWPQMDLYIATQRYEFLP